MARRIKTNMAGHAVSDLSTDRRFGTTATLQLAYHNERSDTNRLKFFPSVHAILLRYHIFIRFPNCCAACMRDKPISVLLPSWSAYVDLKTESLRYLGSAGHQSRPIILGEADVNATEGKNCILFVGVLEDMEYTDEEISCLKKNTRSFSLYNGITETENASKELYGEDHLIMKPSAPLGPVAKQYTVIVDSMHSFRSLPCTTSRSQ